MCTFSSILNFDFNLYLSFVKSFRTPFVLNKLSKNVEMSPLSMKCLNFSFASLDSVRSQIVMDPSDKRSMVECIPCIILSSDSGISCFRALYTLKLSLPSTCVILNSTDLTVELEADILNISCGATNFLVNDILFSLEIFLILALR